MDDEGEEIGWAVAVIVDGIGIFGFDIRDPALKEYEEFDVRELAKRRGVVVLPSMSSGFSPLTAF